MVRCVTLDSHFNDRFDQVDLLDINTEGHDYQVLQGADRLFTNGFIQCVKIEFELTEVWLGQGWFADIDIWLRQRQYDLAHLEIECAKPTSAAHLYHGGEPLWGKAIYVPGYQRWRKQRQHVPTEAMKEAVLKAVVLYTILDLPGRAIDLLTLVAGESDILPFRREYLTAQIAAVFHHAKLDAAITKLTSRLRRFFSIIT